MRACLITISVFLSLNSFSFTQKRFNFVIDKVTDIYKSELEADNNKLVINKDWESNSKNAGINRKDNTITLTVAGGYVRENSLSEDALALTVCHEIGHIIGGSPKVHPTRKYSSEAQSDYFASAKCIKRYFKKFPRLVSDIELSSLPSNRIKECKKIYQDELICLRTLLAINNESNILAKKTSLSLKDSTIVETTIFNDYPSDQCRVDTLVAGALCSRDPSTNEFCNSGIGKRPACWFVQNQSTPDWEYDENNNYPEAQVLGEISSVTKNLYGCHYEVSDITFFAGSYVSSFDEEDLWEKGFETIDNCPFKSKESFSGILTRYKGKLYFRVNPVDKSL